MPNYPYSSGSLFLSIVSRQGQVKPNNQGGLGVEVVSPAPPPTLLLYFPQEVDGPAVPLAPNEYWQPKDRDWIKYLRCRQQCTEDRGVPVEEDNGLVVNPPPPTGSPSWIACYSGNGSCTGLPGSPPLDALLDRPEFPEDVDDDCLAEKCRIATGNPSCKLGIAPDYTDAEIQLLIAAATQCWTEQYEEWRLWFEPRGADGISCWLCMEAAREACCNKCESIKPQYPPSPRIPPIENYPCFPGD